MVTSWHLVRTVFDINPEPMVVLDAETKMVIANTALSELMNISPEDIKGMDILSIQSLAAQEFDLKSDLKTAFTQGRKFQSDVFEVTSSPGKQKFCIRGRIIKKDHDAPYRILLQFIKQG